MRGILPFLFWKSVPAAFAQIVYLTCPYTELPEVDIRLTKKTVCVCVVLYTEVPVVVYIERGIPFEA